VTDLGVVLLDLHVRVGVGAGLLVEDEGVAADHAPGVLGARLDPHQPAIAGPAPALRDRLRHDRRRGVGGGVDHLGAGVLVLALAGEGDGEHLAVRTRLHQVHGWVLHGQAGPQVAVDPLHGGVSVGDRPLGHEIEHVVGPVLDGRVTAPPAGLDDDLHDGGMEGVGGVDRRRATLDVVHVGVFVDDDQGPLELAHVLGVDPEVGLERLLDPHARRHVDERSARPHGGVEGSELVVVGRDDGAEVLTDEIGVLPQRRVHVHEKDAHLLEFLAVAVVDHLRLVLGGHPGQVLALRLGDAQLLIGLLDGLGNHVPVLGLLLGGLDVVVDVVEVDGVEQAATTPLRNRLAEEALVGLQPEIEHPLGLALHGRHLADDVLVKPLLGLEDVVLLVTPSELVRTEIDIDCGHWSTHLSGGNRGNGAEP